MATERDRATRLVHDLQSQSEDQARLEDRLDEQCHNVQELEAKCRQLRQALDDASCESAKREKVLEDLERDVTRMRSDIEQLEQGAHDNKQTVRCAVYCVAVRYCAKSASD